MLVEVWFYRDTSSTKEYNKEPTERRPCYKYRFKGNTWKEAVEKASRLARKNGWWYSIRTKPP